MQAPYRIELPNDFGMGSVNAWLFTEPEVVLVDSGEHSEHSWKALNEQLAAYGVSVADIQKIYITHAHVDHVGMAARVVAASGATVYIPEYAYDICVNTKAANLKRFEVIENILLELDPNPQAPLNLGYRMIFEQFQDYWIPIPKEKAVPVPMQDFQVEMGGASWEVMYAPGHCNNQICFYQKEKEWLLSADMILKLLPSPVIEPTIAPPYQRNQSMGQLIDSLKRFRALPIQKAFPGHYEIIEDVESIIDHQLSRIQMREKMCHDYLSKQKASFFEVVVHLYGQGFSPPCIPATLGYLDLLDMKGFLKKQSTVQGVVYSV